jgi:hypothetical protein
MKFSFGEVIIDEIEKDIRVRIKDNIIKIVFDDSGLKEILVDDVIVYENLLKVQEMKDKCYALKINGKTFGHVFYPNEEGKIDIFLKRTEISALMVL